ncbi:MAG: serine hydrolase [Thermomonas sp.]|uniref:serine hydrolase domain-containing protein n=1 Tax=Thermomonas sp. TaxID=1971895 RepID=UPI0039E6A414
MSRRAGWLLGMAFALAGVAAAWVVFRPDLALRVATGTVAHDLCSETFVSGQEPAVVYTESLRPRPGFGLVAWGIGYQVDRRIREVAASFLGVAHSRAVYRDGVGCALVYPGIADARIAGVSTHAFDEETSPVEPQSAPLSAALDAAFAEPVHGPLRHTKAVVVMRDGHIIAERYAPGYHIDTPVLGFSMSKSVLNALVGVLVRQGRLQAQARAPVAAWASRGDPRRAITIEQLMRMQSGLALDETGSGFDPSNRMFYTEPDMAGYAMRARLAATPGTRWAYSSASTQLLARIVRDHAGGDARSVQDFAMRELFAPLGMRHVVMEMDVTGTPVGAHYILASARDWARFGNLYLDDGSANGRRILPSGWVGFSARQTVGTDYAYGAGWWTNRGGGHRLGHIDGAPDDAFFAFGNLGQRIAVVPSERLVVVRLARAQSPTGDNEGFGRLVAEVIAASRASASPARP